MEEENTSGLKHSWGAWIDPRSAGITAILTEVFHGFSSVSPSCLRYR
jgi:hypothetical protein